MSTAGEINKEHCSILRVAALESFLICPLTSQAAMCVSR